MHGFEVKEGMVPFEYTHLESNFLMSMLPCFGQSFGASE